jgi:uncharacterized protein (DUF1778 family)
MFNKNNMSKYIKTPESKTQILKIRLDEQQKNELTRWAHNENKTITRIVLEAIKDKRKKFPV